MCIFVKVAKSTVKMAQLSRGALLWRSMKPLLHRHVSVVWASTYKAVIFDMFGVLIPSPLAKATEWEEKNDVPHGTIGRAIRTGGDGNSWKKYMRGEQGPEEFVQTFSQDCSRIVGFKVHIGSFHSALTSGSMTQPLSAMMEAVQGVRAEGLKTAVLSNNFLLPGGNSFLPLDPSLFDVIIESCKVGMCKPDPRIYLLCADRLGVLPQEAVFLDDLCFNVEAAERVGMHGIVVKDPISAVKELEQVLNMSLSGFVTGTRSVRSSQQLPVDRLAQYLDKAIQVPHADPITVRQFSQSHFDSAYLLTCGGSHLVLKKKPNTESLRKECRLLKGLKGVGVPVPDVLAQCEVASVLDTPFYLTSYSQGHIFNNPFLPGLAPDRKRSIYETMVQTLCQIHRVDLKTTGLEDLREPGNFMKSQVKRWAQQYKASTSQPSPAMNRLIDWLLLHLPQQQRTTLLHGDYRLDNLLFDSEKSVVRAVLGWGLSTVGDPIVDLACSCMSLYETCNPASQPGNELALNGVPSAEEMFELYSRTMGLESIPNWQFYMSFSFFRQAVILQSNHANSLNGAGSTCQMEAMAELAWHFATKEGFRIFNAMPRAAGL
ncbi:acyl-CoA dehydrogenase family member 10 isoform X1 [Electrophorus electricus]|uniref:acyl-CoA dehydrogenase family member 10 isoform X1 n=2 Tax=Electrophorus electricus TaxID=8005 RepID=UPI0015CFC732|nr:acyl-CoA dehydrogenase family member 10 isoform X1 [Electrophorus electricus]